MTEFEKSTIRHLAAQGLNACEIAGRVGRAVSTIHAALARMGIVARCGGGTGAEFQDYELPHLDDDEYASLTDRQRREREIAEMRAFRLKIDFEMTATTAREVLRRTDAELKRELEIDEAKARVLRKTARRFRRRLALAAAGERGMSLRKFQITFRNGMGCEELTETVDAPDGAAALRLIRHQYPGARDFVVRTKARGERIRIWSK